MINRYEDYPAGCEPHLSRLQGDGFHSKRVAMLFENFLREHGQALDLLAAGGARRMAKLWRKAGRKYQQQARHVRAAASFRKAMRYQSVLRKIPLKIAMERNLRWAKQKKQTV